MLSSKFENAIWPELSSPSIKDFRGGTPEHEEGQANGQTDKRKFSCLILDDLLSKVR